MYECQGIVFSADYGDYSVEDCQVPLTAGVKEKDFVYAGPESINDIQDRQFGMA